MTFSTYSAYEEIQEITTLQWNILNILENMDSYGLRISEIISDSTSGQVYKLPGTIYPALKKLHSKKYLEKYKDDSLSKIRRGKPRMMYTITPKGRNALELFRLQNCYLNNAHLYEAY